LVTVPTTSIPLGYAEEGASISIKGMQATADSVRSVRRESGMEECGNTSDIQVSDEPLELSIIDHSMM
jgi:uncharacterized 2Fe-2S/4Fe-4S cluster protein (DUF4445 family)